jgi:acetoacetyl-CoA synthetase
MKVEAWDESGSPVYGQSGDLVCSKPFPVMPVFFWADKDGKKYKDAYFGKFQGVWYHGDFLIVNEETGGVIMLGRRYLFVWISMTCDFLDSSIGEAMEL